MNVIHTKVFSSKEEMEELRVLVSKGWQQGQRMMVFSVEEGIRRDQATLEVIKSCHELALTYGLPEIKGLYGISQKGEFVYLKEEWWNLDKESLLKKIE